MTYILNKIMALSCSVEISKNLKTLVFSAITATLLFSCKKTSNQDSEEKTAVDSIATIQRPTESTPGDMKNILAQLVEAEKSAQANVIRRREETAATRSLLNTAKVMENNPVALRLKELETLERVAERIDNISVFGGLDQVLHGLVNIKG